MSLLFKRFIKDTPEVESKNKKWIMIVGLTFISFLLSLFATAITKRYGNKGRETKNTLE